MGGFRIVVVSSAPANEISHLLARIAREAPGAQVAGVLCERREKPHSGFVRRAASNLGHSLLRFAQASSVKFSGLPPLLDAALGHKCRSRGIEIRFSPDIESAESREFVRSTRADLGVAFAMRADSPSILGLPPHGFICGPLCAFAANAATPQWVVSVGLETLESRPTRAIRSRSFPIDSFDSAVSLKLKSDLLGEDLLIEALRDWSLAGSTDNWNKQESPAASSMTPANPLHFESRSRYRAPRTRPAWKLALRSSAYLWLLPFRNWTRRLRKRFPLVILFHHLVSDRPHPMGISTEAFLAQVQYLKRHYRLVSLAEGLRLLDSSSIDQPTAVLTFDDGYADNFLAMRAVLRVEPAPVTMFVCPELIETGRAFPHDERDHREGFAPLTTTELGQMAVEGMEIGSHTRTHFNCGSTEREVLEREIAGSRRDLENLVGQAIPFFSFPWGKPANMSEPAVEIAGKSYQHFFSAYGGANFPGVRGQHRVRSAHPHSLWELELTLQQLLEIPRGDMENLRARFEPAAVAQS